MQKPKKKKNEDPDFLDDDSDDESADEEAEDRW